MKQLLLAACVLLLGFMTATAGTTKSKSQLKRERDWREKARQGGSAIPANGFVFLDLAVGGSKEDAEGVIQKGPGKATLSKTSPPVKIYDSETVIYDGNHKLGKVRTTELTFFQGRLIRIVVNFATTNAALTYEAVVLGLESKYGEFPDKEKSRRDKGLSIKKDSVVLTVRTQRGPKGEEVVIVVDDKDMEQREWETQVEKEKGSIGEF